MTVPTSLAISIAVGILILLAVFTLFAVRSLNEMLGFMFVSRARKRFIKGIINVLNESQSDADCFDQVDILYTALVDACKGNNCSAQPLVVELEQVLNIANTTTSTAMLHQFDAQPSPHFKEKLLMVIRARRANYPFESLDYANVKLLNDIRCAINNGETQLALHTLNQHANEVAEMENRIKAQDVAMKKSFVISVVGTVLTVVFGVVSIIQFIVTALRP